MILYYTQLKQVMSIMESSRQNRHAALTTVSTCLLWHDTARPLWLLALSGRCIASFVSFEMHSMVESFREILRAVVFMSLFTTALAKAAHGMPYFVSILWPSMQGRLGRFVHIKAPGTGAAAMAGLKV